MSCITICIPDELEIALRRLSRRKFGDKQGKLSRAAREAIFEWCQNEKLKYSEEDDDF